MSGTQVIIMGAGGRMGSTLMRLAREDRDLQLVGAVERGERLEGLQGGDITADSDPRAVFSAHPGAVVVDFSHPQATVETVRAAEENGNPMVIGTTGFDQAQNETLQEAAVRIPLFMAPNMSVGINVLLEFLPKLGELLGPDYDIEISEIHHKHKKDAPSGTAVKLAQSLADLRGWDEGSLRYARQGMIGERPEEEIGVQTLRGGDVVGEHTVYFMGPGERIDLTHRVYSRDTFAQGALRAAKWLSGKKAGRIYSMRDLFADLMG